MDHKDKTGTKISDRISLATRTYAATSGGGEAFQIANYGIGGVYNHHPDSMNLHSEMSLLSKENKEMASTWGDRVATFMGYLSHVELGGATVFPSLGLTLWPEKGSAAFWWNLQGNGLTDLLTLHGGCPVLVGSKW